MAHLAGTARVVLVTAPIGAHWRERLQGLSPELQVEFWPSHSAGTIPDNLWREVEVLYTSFTTPLPAAEQAPQLRWVQLYSAGPDSIVNAPLFRTSITFTTTSGIHAITMAEYVFAVALAWFHRLPRLLEWQQQGQWPTKSERSSLFVGEEMQGKTIGIVGYGSVGRQVARLASAFGTHVVAMQRGADHRDHGFLLPDAGDPEGVLPRRFYTFSQLHDMLGESDIVVIAVPLTSHTRHMFDEAAFRAMKSTAFLINIARGDVCDEAALLSALQEKRIAGAALDVFHQEPLPSDHPLWRLPNVFISPHTAGLTPRYDELAATVFEENMRRYLVDKPLYNIVDKAQEY